MNPDNRRKLIDRVIRAAEAALAAQKYVSSIDVLAGIGWLDPGLLKRWQQGQIGYLEEGIQDEKVHLRDAIDQEDHLADRQQEGSRMTPTASRGRDHPPPTDTG
jgi:hypothetical protein